MVVVTLDELAQMPYEDTAKFGEKARGFWWLYQVKDELFKDWDGAEYSLFSVQSGYSLDGSESIHSTDVQRAILNLAGQSINTNGELFENKDNIFSGEEPKLLIARSSAQVELSGQYYSGVFYADPSNPDLTLAEWEREATKVRESGADGIVVQALYGGRCSAKNALARYYDNGEKKNRELFSFSGYDFDQHDLVIGPGSFSFVGNTYSQLSDEVSFGATVGLATKIVRGDGDIAFLHKTHNHGLLPVYMNKNYTGLSASSEFEFNTIDVVAVKPNPQVVSVSASPLLPDSGFVHPEGGLMPIPFEASPMRLGELLFRLKKLTGREVEVEGGYDSHDYFPNLHQLRLFDRPQGSETTLTGVDESKVLFSGLSVGYGSFENHLVIAENGFKEKDLKFSIPTDYILMPSDVELARSISKEQFPNCVGVVFPQLHSLEQKYNIFAHLTGLTLQLIARTNIPSFGIWSNLSNFVHDKTSAIDGLYGDHFEISNVRAESDGKRGQIYKSL